jgi:isopropylmalate/homocitrate/citramalate synthase
MEKGASVLLIDATLPALAALGRNPDIDQCHLWVKTLGRIGVAMVKWPKEPVVAPEALYGLDGALDGDYASLFKRLRRLGYLEVVFGDDKGFATALAVAWLEEGGSGVVASLTGIGGLPALETARIYLHLSGRMRLPELSQPFAEVRRLFEEMAGTSVGLFAPVLGEGLFVGESGVHVDSWLMDPSLYEPYPPELVGSERAIAIGRHSGQGAVKLKGRQLGLDFSRGDLRRLLALIREKAEKLERSLTDAEFADLASGLSSLPDGPPGSNFCG